MYLLSNKTIYQSIEYIIYLLKIYIVLFCPVKSCQLVTKWSLLLHVPEKQVSGSSTTTNRSKSGTSPARQKSVVQCLFLDFIAQANFTDF